MVLYRRLLAKQPDHSVTMVSIGGYTNLAGLLRSKAGQGSKLDGRALITKKVKSLVIEDGLQVGLGTHHELLETCPTYAEIVASQLTEEEAA